MEACFVTCCGDWPSGMGRYALERITVAAAYSCLSNHTFNLRRLSDWENLFVRRASIFLLPVGKFPTPCSTGAFTKMTMTASAHMARVQLMSGSNCAFPITCADASRDCFQQLIHFYSTYTNYLTPPVHQVTAAPHAGVRYLRQVPNTHSIHPAPNPPFPPSCPTPNP